MIIIKNLDTGVLHDLEDDLGKSFYTDFSTRFISEGLIDISLTDSVIFKTYSDSNSDITLHYGSKLSTIPYGSFEQIIIE